MTDLHTVKVGIGIGELLFGSSRDDVRKYLGSPDKIDIDRDTDGMKHELWIYELIGGSVSFDEEDDFRLSIIETSSPLATLEGMCVIGLARDAVLSHLCRFGIGNMTNNEDNLEKITFDDVELNLWFELDILRDIQWSVLFDEYDKISWPKQKS